MAGIVELDTVRYKKAKKAAEAVKNVCILYGEKKIEHTVFFVALASLLLYSLCQHHWLFLV